MQTSRLGFLAFVGFALAILVSGRSAKAEELVGRISKVDTEAKKVVVMEQGSDKSVDVTITSQTVIETGKGGKSADLEKLRQRVDKAKKGVSVQVTLENGVASKIKVVRKKAKE